MKIGHVVLGVPRHLLMAALRPLETRLLKASNPQDCNAVFIIGPPRSGTSLLFELLVTRYQFSYFSNLSHRLYKTPAAATYLGRQLIRRWQGDFQSDYGHIPGWGSPCEAGWIWRKWLPNQPGISASDVALDSQLTMQHTVASIAQYLDAPFLSKNVEHSIHIQALSNIFPTCSFIQITRNETDVVQSIIRARIQESHSKKNLDWYSVKPCDWELYAGKDATLQSCAQIVLMQRNIDADIAAIGEDRRHTLSYESLCNNTHEVLDGIASFLEARGTRITKRKPVPHSFVRSGSADDPSTEREKIKELLDSLEPNDAQVESFVASQARVTQGSNLKRRKHIDEETIA